MRPTRQTCRRLTKADGALDFNAPASVRSPRGSTGLFPWPGVTVEIIGQPIKLGLADHGDGVGCCHPATRAGASPGTVLGADAEGPCWWRQGRGRLYVCSACNAPEEKCSRPLNSSAVFRFLPIASFLAADAGVGWARLANMFPDRTTQLWLPTALGKIEC